MSDKQQPYMMYYMKKGSLWEKLGIGHVRVKYVDENGTEHIRGLNQSNAGKTTVYEKDLKDSEGFGIDQYTASNKIPLSPQQSRQVKELISQTDENHEKYSFFGGNCVDFVNKFHKIYNKQGDFEEALSQEQKSSLTLSRYYNKDVYSYPQKKFGMSSQELVPDLNVDKKEATELKRAWGKIMHDNEEKEQKPAQSEEKTRKSYYERYKEHENPLEDLLYKKPEELTKEEVEQAHKHSFETQDPEERRRYDKVVTDYYQHNYRNEPQQQDETGKGIEPQAVRQIPEQSSGLLAKSGRPVDDEVKSLSERLQKIEEDPYHDNGVRGLQRGLNLSGATPQLKEDGELGPKTTSAWKRAAINEDTDKLSRSVGVGSMENLVSKNRGKRLLPDELDSSVRTALGEDGGAALQRSLNETGSKRESYEVLKEDNDIREKTASSFNQLKEEDEEGLFSSLEKMIV